MQGGSISDLEGKYNDDEIPVALLGKVYYHHPRTIIQKG